VIAKTRKIIEKKRDKIRIYIWVADMATLHRDIGKASITYIFH